MIVQAVPLYSDFNRQRLLVLLMAFECVYVSSSTFLKGNSMKTFALLTFCLLAASVLANQIPIAVHENLGEIVDPQENAQLNVFG